MGQLIRNGESLNLRRVVEHDHTSAVEGGLIDFDFTPPVGTIIPFYDFNGALTFNSVFWDYCDGRSVTIAGIGLQTLPDLSNRYLVGFGTEGGGNMDTASWATAAVGNVSHEINISHSHTVNSHSHTVNSHSHTIPGISSSGSSSSGTTGSGGSGLTGTISTNTSFSALPENYAVYTNGGVQSTTKVLEIDNSPGVSDHGKGQHRHTGNSHTHTIPVLSVSVTSSATVTGDASPSTSSSSPGTDSQLSSSQSIQPRSIRVRFLMRIL